MDDPRPSKSWTLLLELVSGDLSPRDDATENHWAWGDAGYLCLWIEEEELKAGRFDEVRATIQC